jgi:hypothetical protein
MAANDLCQLADVKLWLGRSDTNSDALLSALITRASRAILTYLQRGQILPRNVSEIRDGTGTSAMVLKQWPVISVTSVMVDDLTIPQASAEAGGSDTGWVCEAWDGTPPGRPQTLSLKGFSFGSSWPGAGNAQNVGVAYQAGYQVSDEPQTVASGVATVLAPYGAWASDMGVAYADGLAMAKVESAPAIGEYALGNTPGQYVFNAGDNGAAVAISYGFVPADISDACIELVSERFKYAQRIGEKTHSLGGNETVSFDNTRFTPLVEAMLQPYRNVAPV